MAALSASAYINKVSEHKDVHVRLKYRHVRNFIGIHCISSAGVVAKTTSLPIMCLAQFPTGKTWPDQIPHERNKCPSTSPTPLHRISIESSRVEIPQCCQHRLFCLIVIFAIYFIHRVFVRAHHFSSLLFHTSFTALKKMQTCWKQVFIKHGIIYSNIFLRAPLPPDTASLGL